MTDWLNDVISNTPIVFVDGIYFKLEYMNFTGSIKDKAAYFMLKALDKSIRVVIEATSGNLGISLAAIGNILGFKVIICMPKDCSLERIKMIRGLGAEVILVEGDMSDCISYAKSLEVPNSIFLDQFNNLNNFLAHYEITGREILNYIPDLDILVCGIGTGGTISGVGNFLKDNCRCLIYGVLPKDKNHHIYGIGAGFKPGILREDLLEGIIYICDDDAVIGVKKLMNLGIMAGISSGACYMASLKIKDIYPKKRIVAVLPDSISRYLSLDIF